VTTTIDAPARVDDVQLLGAMVGSGYRTPPSLVRRGDGQTLQLTPLLYLVLDAIDGQRSCAEIATVVSRAMRRSVSEEMVATLVDEHLRPMGLLKLADGSAAPLKRSNPLLALKLKFAVTNPRATRRLTDPFRFLFRPALVGIVVLGFLAITWWVFFERGLAPAAYDAFQRPHLLLLVFVVTVLSGGFHEFGHAAAARYGGADPGVIGAGVYLVWPGVLHRRDRQLPVGPAGTPQDRPGRPVLQRHRGRG
jgi:putative peptide zinc metalloprotease protein